MKFQSGYLKMRDNSTLEVAVVDDGVNTFLLSHLSHLSNRVNNYTVWNGHVFRRFTETEITHGTICASFIAALQRKINISSIKVKEHNSEGHINNLVKALNYCCKKDIDLINVSIGSIDDTDQIFLKQPIQQLVEKGTLIVAAVCNSGIRTYPASMPGVLSIKHTHKDECIITYNEKSYVINIKLPRIQRLFGKDIYLQQCNSYYTALVTQRIADIMICEKTKNPNKIIKKLYMYN